VGALEVSWEERSARLAGRLLELTTAEFELLSVFVRNRGRVLTRDRIMEATRGVDWEVYDRSIGVLVSHRQKLGDDVGGRSSRSCAPVTASSEVAVSDHARTGRPVHLRRRWPSCW
jgi:DNA-binding response OmpR family regulator